MADMQELQRKAIERARKGILKLVIDKGGSAQLGEMHDHSERKYLMGHRKFSDLMEGLVADKLVDYNAADSTATITDAGREYATATT